MLLLYSFCAGVHILCTYYLSVNVIEIGKLFLPMLLIPVLSVKVFDTLQSWCLQYVAVLHCGHSLPAIHAVILTPLLVHTQFKLRPDICSWLNGWPGCF